jgi:hypothetical protein
MRSEARKFLWCHLPTLWLSGSDTLQDQDIRRVSDQPDSDHGEAEERHEVGEQFIHRTAPFWQRS